MDKPTEGTTEQPPPCFDQNAGYAAAAGAKCAVEDAFERGVPIRAVVVVMVSRCLTAEHGNHITTASCADPREKLTPREKRHLAQRLRDLAGIYEREADEASN